MKTKRKTKRFSASSIIELEDSQGNKITGSIFNLHSHGACVISNKEVSIGTELKIGKLLGIPGITLPRKAITIWTAIKNDGYVTGIRFLEKSSDETLSRFELFNQRSKIDTLKIVLFLGVPLVPIIALAFSFFFPDQPYRWFVTSLFSFLIFERLWETFFTSKDSRSFESSEDWSLTAVSFYYILLYLLSLCEFFLLQRRLNLPIASFGILIVLASFAIRLISMKTLGNQWKVHAMGSDKNTNLKRQIINNGPYRFLRHPLYLAFILEVVSIPLICSSYLSLGFGILVNIPLQVLRSKLEEKNIINQVGIEYLEYALNTPAYIPKIESKK